MHLCLIYAPHGDCALLESILTRYPCMMLCLSAMLLRVEIPLTGIYTGNKRTCQHFSAA